MRRLRGSRKLLTLFVAGLVALSLSAAGITRAQNDNAAQPVYVMTIDDDIKAGTALEVSRSLRIAEENNASHLIIQLDTPGGLLQSTKDIVDSMTESDVETVVFVHRSGGWAYSAGTIMLMAADHAYAHPSANIGAAQPYSTAGDNSIQDEKAQKATAAWIRSLAEMHGRDPEIAEQFVSENVTLSGLTAHGARAIDGTAESLDDLLGQLGVQNAETRDIEPSYVSSIFNVLSHPYFVSLFLTLGGLAFLLAIRSGEFAMSTAIGAVLLLCGLWGMGVIEFSLVGVGLILIGILLLMIEIFDQPGVGVFGIGGLASIVAGFFVMNEEPFFAPGLLDSMTIAAFLTLVVAMIGFGIISRAVARTLTQTSVTGAEALAGKTATVTTALNPTGRVKVGTESWRAELVGGKSAPENAKVRIMSVKGNTLRVQSTSKGRKK